MSLLGRPISFSSAAHSPGPLSPHSTSLCTISASSLRPKVAGSLRFSPVMGGSTLLSLTKVLNSTPLCLPCLHLDWQRMGTRPSFSPTAVQSMHCLVMLLVCGLKWGLLVYLTTSSASCTSCVADVGLRYSSDISMQPTTKLFLPLLQSIHHRLAVPVVAVRGGRSTSPDTVGA